MTLRIADARVNTTAGRPTAAALMVALVLLLGGASPLPATGGASRWSPASASGDAPHRPDSDHLYRIVGRVRLLLFWVSADDVGGARVTWREVDHQRTVALLIGSDPRRAPREVNEWGYVREEVAGEVTSVFGIRTVTDGDSPKEAEARRSRDGGLVEFGMLCSTVSRLDASSRTATVHLSRDATYRDVGQILARLPGDTQWYQRQAARPAGVAPGFLTALDELMRSSAAAARVVRAIPAIPSVAYVYRDAVYDLTARDVTRVPRLQTATHVFKDLLRADLTVRNRRTGATEEFSVTYGITEFSVDPVHAVSTQLKPAELVDETGDVLKTASEPRLVNGCPPCADPGELSILSSQFLERDLMSDAVTPSDTDAARTLAAIVESSDDAIIAKNLDGTILSWNGGAERMYGYAASEVIGRSIYLIVPEPVVSQLSAILERIRTGERVRNFETVRQTKDGRRIDVALSISRF